MHRLLPVFVLVLAACVGCGGGPEHPFDRAAPVFPLPENTFEEDVSARKPYAEPPAWLYKPQSYPDRKPGCVYFVGYGLPMASLQEARDSALEDAQRQIVRYMSTSVDVSTERVGAAVGDTRGGGYEAVTDHIFSTTVARDTVDRLYARDQYYTAGTLVQNIVKRPVHIAYVLVEFGPHQAEDVAVQANSEVKSEIKELEQQKEASPSKQLDERDAVRLDSLQRLEKKLDNLSADDFKF